MTSLNIVSHLIKKNEKTHDDQFTSIVVEVGHEAEGEGPPEVTEPEELGLLVVLTCLTHSTITIGNTKSTYVCLDCYLYPTGKSASVICVVW